ncbi:unnamed protein product [Parnassius apollo]|uniref:(apollo) hypothetical protein n=1 Tax=Parnassius apollo TaxID=110799 RepID=A0A8S3WVE4_PARAO|nr:unnamed protein product [Parnassius apollo]
MFGWLSESEYIFGSEWHSVCDVKLMAAIEMEVLVALVALEVETAIFSGCEVDCGGNEVVKKWRSVKDNFFRYVKKIKENSSSGSGAKQLKKYHYYNQLLFLMKVAQNKTDSSLEMVSEETERNENTASSSPFPTKEMSSLPQVLLATCLQAVRDQTKQ